MPFMQRITWSGMALHEGALPGYPASHGCIRLSHDFAQKLWPITKLGVRVIVVAVRSCAGRLRACQAVRAEAPSRSVRRRFAQLDRPVRLAQNEGVRLATRRRRPVELRCRRRSRRGRSPPVRRPRSPPKRRRRPKPAEAAVHRPNTRRTGGRSDNDRSPDGRQAGRSDGRRRLRTAASRRAEPSNCAEPVEAPQPAETQSRPQPVQAAPASTEPEKPAPDLGRSAQADRRRGSRSGRSAEEAYRPGRGVRQPQGEEDLHPAGLRADVRDADHDRPAGASARHPRLHRHGHDRRTATACAGI